MTSLEKYQEFFLSQFQDESFIERNFLFENGGNSLNVNVKNLIEVETPSESNLDENQEAVADALKRIYLAIVIRSAVMGCPYGISALVENSGRLLISLRCKKVPEKISLTFKKLASNLAKSASASDFSKTVIEFVNGNKNITDTVIKVPILFFNFSDDNILAYNTFMDQFMNEIKANYFVVMLLGVPCFIQTLENAIDIDKLSTVEFDETSKDSTKLNFDEFIKKGCAYEDFLNNNMLVGINELDVSHNFCWLNMGKFDKRILEKIGYRQQHMVDMKTNVSDPEDKLLDEIEEVIEDIHTSNNYEYKNYVALGQFAATLTIIDVLLDEDGKFYRAKPANMLNYLLFTAKKLKEKIDMAPVGNKIVRILHSISANPAIYRMAQSFGIQVQYLTPYTAYEYYENIQNRNSTDLCLRKNGEFLVSLEDEISKYWSEQCAPISPADVTLDTWHFFLSQHTDMMRYGDSFSIYMMIQMFIHEEFLNDKSCTDPIEKYKPDYYYHEKSYFSVENLNFNLSIKIDGLRFYHSNEVIQEKIDSLKESNSENDPKIFVESIPSSNTMRLNVYSKTDECTQSILQEMHCFVKDLIMQIEGLNLKRQ